jgi:hypothetical protein
MAMSEMCGVCRQPVDPVGMFAGEFVCDECADDVRERGYLVVAIE